MRIRNSPLVRLPAPFFVAIQDSKSRAYLRTSRTNLQRTRNSSSVSRSGYTLIEVLIVVTILGIVASVAVPAMSSPSFHGLKSTGRVCASDLRLASQLAIQYGTTYTVDLDVSGNRYELRHTGTSNPPALQNPNAAPGSIAGKYVVEVGSFGENGSGTQGVRLIGAELKTSRQSVNNISFGPQGGTGPSRTEDTAIWFCRGTGANRQYLRLSVAAVTGQVWIDQPSTFPAP